MKTGFIVGYANKPGEKQYSYHGLERKCFIQNTVLPVRGEDINILYGPPIETFFNNTLPPGWKDRNMVYQSCHDSLFGYRNTFYIGQEYYDSSKVYTIHRGFNIFQTDTLPDNCLIVSAYLKIVTLYMYPAEAFHIVVRDGFPNWPDQTNPKENYFFYHYRGNLGEAPAEGFTTLIINLNEAGLGRVGRSGPTKFGLFSDRDIAEIAPTTVEMMAYTNQMDQHQLWVTYRVPL